MKKITVSKRQILQRKGDLNTKVYIVESGLLRSYIIDQKGKEYIYMFGPENWLVTDNCEPTEACTLYIDALEESVVQVISKKDALNTNPDLYPLLKRIKTMQARILMLMSASAKERYEHFIQTYPEITQRVPLHMIASYLGITPEALSRVRKGTARGK